MLNNLPGVTSVHGRFYDLSSKYYRIIGNHAAYYKDALRYLGCVDIKDLPGEQKHDEKQPSGSWSTELNVVASHRDGEAGAGLHSGTGGTLRRGRLQLWRAGGIFATVVIMVYVGQPSGGSLSTSAVVSLQLMHPVLESLRNTDKQWLIDTLYAFNGGNVEKFQGFKSAWGQQVMNLSVKKSI